MKVLMKYNVNYIFIWYINDYFVFVCKKEINNFEEINNLWKLIKYIDLDMFYFFKWLRV